MKGKRASISAYGCIADPETRGKEDCPDKIQETAEVSTKLTFQTNAQWSTIELDLHI